MKNLIVAAAIFLAGCSTPRKQAEPEPAKSVPRTPQAIVPTPQPGPAPGIVSYNVEKLACSKGNESRTLEVIRKAAGCELKYTKAGKSSFISNSAHGKKHCEQSQTKLREKLEKAGFQCDPV